MKSDVQAAVCAFCGRGEDKVPALLGESDKKVFICSDCLSDYYSAWEEASGETGGKTKKPTKKLAPIDFKKITPQELKAHLDAYVIGQERAKKLRIEILCCI